METPVAVKINTDKSFETGMEALYEHAFPVVAGFVRKMGGSFDDARDLFHDSLVIYFEMNSRSTPLNPQAYILGIAKHLWLRKFRNAQDIVSLSEKEQLIQIPDDYFVSVQTQKLLTFLERAGKKCMDLLRAFYFQKQRIQLLVKNLGFANEHSASVQKYKCLEKMRDMVKQKSMTYEDFVE